MLVYYSYLILFHLWRKVRLKTFNWYVFLARLYSYYFAIKTTLRVSFRWESVGGHSNSTRLTTSYLFYLWIFISQDCSDVWLPSFQGISRHASLDCPFLLYLMCIHAFLHWYALRCFYLFLCSSCRYMYDSCYHFSELFIKIWERRVSHGYWVKLKYILDNLWDNIWSQSASYAWNFSYSMWNNRRCNHSSWKIMIQNYLSIYIHMLDKVDSKKFSSVFEI